MSIIQERQFNLGDFEENMFKIGLSLDTYEWFSFNLGMMIGTSKHYSINTSAKVILFLMKTAMLFKQFLSNHGSAMYHVNQEFCQHYIQ